MRVANTGIKRTRHPIPTLEHHNILLPSRTIPLQKISDGTNAAAELFQHTLQQTLQEINAIKNIVDDKIAFGNTREEHDRALEEYLTTLQEYTLSFDFEKCTFLKKNLEFFDLVFTQQSVGTNPK